MLSRRNLLWILWAASALVTIALFFIPAFIIRPFTHQTARGIVLAMAVRDRAPLGTLLAALIFLALTVFLWSAVNLWRRIGIGVVAALVVFSTVMARQNYFEWMFHPVDTAQFINEADSKLNAGEMILSIRFGSDARAYPISQMAYHHILNDVVEGVPVAVTY
jgi:membrane protease YdiL (CAAX protease family)